MCLPSPVMNQGLWIGKLGWITATFFRTFFSRNIQMSCSYCRCQSSYISLIPLQFDLFKTIALRTVEAQFVAWNQKWFLTCVVFSHLHCKMVSKTIFIQVRGSTTWTVFKGSGSSNCIWPLSPLVCLAVRSAATDLIFLFSVHYISKKSVKPQALAMEAKREKKKMWENSR